MAYSSTDLLSCARFSLSGPPTSLYSLERGDVPAGLENDLHQLNRQCVYCFGGLLLGVELLLGAERTGRLLS